MYGIKILKRDLDLLNLLAAGGYPHPPITADQAGNYLIVTPAPNNGKPTAQIVTEREFDEQYADKVSTSGPTLLKLNKRARS